MPRIFFKIKNKHCNILKEKKLYIKYTEHK